MKYTDDVTAVEATDREHPDFLTVFLDEAVTSGHPVVVNTNIMETTGIVVDHDDEWLRLQTMNHEYPSDTHAHLCMYRKTSIMTISWADGRRYTAIQHAYTLLRIARSQQEDAL